jgi:hypothetical protein
MKKILALCLLISSFSVFSASVKVTSFNYVRNANDLYHPLAELCGIVTEATSFPTFIKVTVDPKSGKPASYNTLAGQDGKFCMAVITYRGSAEVSIIGENSTTEALVK